MDKQITPDESAPDAFPWFAWRPVWTRERGWVWLRFVLRRHVPPLLGTPGAVWTWEHTIPKMRPAPPPDPCDYTCSMGYCPHEGGPR